jgi:hypothetical protein
LESNTPRGLWEEPGGRTKKWRKARPTSGVYASCKEVTTKPFRY